MSDVKYFSRGSLNPIDGARAAIFKARYFRANPTFFDPDGIWVFTGPQGSGKTLSCVHTAIQMADYYPRALLCSNIDIKGYEDRYIPFESYDQLSELDNGIEGVIFVLDELHILWNSLESKNVPFSEMATFCQMRKARRIILGTSQVYGRIAKPIREQLKYCFICQNYLGIFQHNVILDPSCTEEKDGHVSAPIVGNNWFFHTPEMYNSYETLSKVRRIDRNGASRC